MERRALAAFAQGNGDMAMSDAQLELELREVIEALDRRVPRLEEAGERAIAHEAAALRAKAVKRLAELGRRTRATAAKTRPS